MTNSSESSSWGARTSIIKPDNKRRAYPRHETAGEQTDASGKQFAMMMTALMVSNSEKFLLRHGHMSAMHQTPPKVTNQEQHQPTTACGTESYCDSRDENH